MSVNLYSAEGNAGNIGLRFPFMYGGLDIL